MHLSGLTGGSSLTFVRVPGFVKSLPCAEFFALRGSNNEVWALFPDELSRADPFPADGEVPRHAVCGVYRSEVERVARHDMPHAAFAYELSNPWRRVYLRDYSPCSRARLAAVAAACASKLVEQHRGDLIVEARFKLPQAVGDSEIADEPHVVFGHGGVLVDIHVHILHGWVALIGRLPGLRMETR